MVERLVIDRLGSRGEGIASTQAGPRYVPYTLPGETSKSIHARKSDRGHSSGCVASTDDRAVAAFGSRRCALQHLATARTAMERDLCGALAQAASTRRWMIRDAHGAGAAAPDPCAARTRDVPEVGLPRSGESSGGSTAVHPARSRRRDRDRMGRRRGPAKPPHARHQVTAPHRPRHRRPRSGALTAESTRRACADRRHAGASQGSRPRRIVAQRSSPHSRSTQDVVLGGRLPAGDRGGRSVACAAGRTIARERAKGDLFCASDHLLAPRSARGSRLAESEADATRRWLRPGGERKGQAMATQARASPPSVPALDLKGLDAGFSIGRGQARRPGKPLAAAPCRCRGGAAIRDFAVTPHWSTAAIVCAGEAGRSVSLFGTVSGRARSSAANSAAARARPID